LLTKMVKYHPDTRFLTDYAAGSLPESQALCVAAHLHYCPSCRTKISELNELGSEFFISQKPETVSDTCFDSIMARLESSPQAEPPPKYSVNINRSSGTLPAAIQKFTGGNIESLNWHNIGKSFRFSNIQMGDNQRETSLLHIQAGGNVPKHHHKGDEITVVLKGSFSDQEDRYVVGDYIVRTNGEAHTPVASQDEDCLCLSTLDSPIVMDNWFYRMLMPLFNRASFGH